MFNQLTKYLLQYRVVSIPYVGTIEIVQQPPQLNAVNKLIQPPTFVAELHEEENITTHQLNFLAASLQQDNDTILHSLEALGHQLNIQILRGGFEWKGIGVLHHSKETIPIISNILDPIPAAKISRQNVEHKELGDNQEYQRTAEELLNKKKSEEKKFSILVLIGWLILLISILYIFFALFIGNFSLHATGSKQPVEQVGK